MQRTEPMGPQEWSDDDAVQQQQDPPQRISSRKERDAAKTEKLQEAMNNLAAKRYCIFYGFIAKTEWYSVEGDDR